MGPDWNKLADLSAQIADEMEKTGLMTDIDSDYRIGTPEVRITPGRIKASERGVSVIDIADAINAMVGGLRVGKYTRGGHRYDIRVQMVSNEQKLASLHDCLNRLRWSIRIGAP